VTIRVKHLRDETIGGFLEVLAAKTPAPGGGAAAGVLAAIGAGLAEMVVNYSRGRRELAAHDDLHHDARQLLEVSRQAALVLADEDAVAYAHLSALQRLPADDARRRAEWAGAVERAMAVPQRVLDLALELLNICEQLLGRSNEHLRSDLAIAAIAAEAAAAAAAWNVRANLAMKESIEEREVLGAQLDAKLVAARRLRENVERACR
jgi:formiminotetrahydrofolate cyclodeaminase